MTAVAVTGMLTWTAPAELPLREFPIAIDHSDPARSIGCDPQLSPNGRHIAYVSHDHFWLRDLASTEPRPLAGTESAYRPFWSPDSQWIGFASEGHQEDRPCGRHRDGDRRGDG